MNKEYPKYSGEGFDAPKFLGDVLRFELDSQGLKNGNLVEAEFRGMKLFEYMGCSRPKGLSSNLSKLKKGIFGTGHEPYKKLAVLYCFLGLDEDSEAVKVLKECAGEDIFPPKEPVKPYDAVKWHNPGDAPRKKKIKIEKIIEQERVPPNDKFGNFN